MMITSREMKIELATNICLFNGKKILMLKKSTEHKLWGPPGGRCELNESLLNCSKRELNEETGILDAQFQKIFSVWTGEAEGKFLHVFQIVGTTSEIKIKISEENNNYNWWKFGDFLDKEKNTYVTKDYILKGWLSKSGISFPIIIVDKKNEVLIKKIATQLNIPYFYKKNEKFYKDLKTKIIFSKKRTANFNVKISFSDDESGISSAEEFFDFRKKLEVDSNEIILSNFLKESEKIKILNQIFKDFKLEEWW